MTRSCSSTSLGSSHASDSRRRGVSYMLCWRGSEWVSRSSWELHRWSSRWWGGGVLVESCTRLWQRRGRATRNSTKLPQRYKRCSAGTNSEVLPWRLYGRLDWIVRSICALSSCCSSWLDVDALGRLSIRPLLRKELWKVIVLLNASSSSKVSTDEWRLRDESRCCELQSTSVWILVWCGQSSKFKEFTVLSEE